jgi:hypothetical protein
LQNTPDTRIAGNFRMVQNLAVFADRPGAARENKKHEILNLMGVICPTCACTQSMGAWVWSRRSEDVKIKTMKKINFFGRALSPQNFAPAKISHYTVPQILGASSYNSTMILFPPLD